MLFIVICLLLCVTKWLKLKATGFNFFVERFSCIKPFAIVMQSIQILYFVYVKSCNHSTTHHWNYLTYVTYLFEPYT